MISVDLKIALKALSATKIRTSLTVLGIVIGVASITVVMAMGEGAKQKMSDQVSQLGSDLLTIRSGQATRDTKGNIAEYNFWAALGSSTIGERDLQTIQSTPNISAASPIMVVTGSVGNVPKQPFKDTTIIATDTHFDKLMNLKVKSGDFLNDSISRNTVVLGQDLALQLLGTDNGIGRKVYIRGQDFTVTGVLDHANTQTNLSSIYNFNRTAFINLDAGKSFNQGVAQIQQINARVTPGHDIKKTAESLQQGILNNHGGEEDFTVLRPEESVKITGDLLKVVTALTTAVASVSLLVGGIGIMNIMLVSITERTREIGIRKAVGATSTQIMRQFLIESLAMSMVGGIIGIIVAYGLAFAIGTYADILPILTWQIILSTLSISTIVGIIFGITPAFKAARKDPIEALRFFN